MNNLFILKNLLQTACFCKNAKQQVQLAYKPKISVTADAGYVSSLTVTPYKNVGASASINLIIPVYDGNRRRLAYRRLNTLEQLRATNSYFFLNNITSRLRSYCSSCKLQETLLMKLTTSLYMCRHS